MYPMLMHAALHDITCICPIYKCIIFREVVFPSNPWLTFSVGELCPYP